MQYSFFLNNKNEQLKDWTQLFSYCTMPELLKRIEAVSKQKKKVYGVQELVKLKACMSADEP